MYKRRGLTHIFYATLFSFKGLKAAIQHETAFKLELVACLFLVPMAFYISSNKIELILLLLPLFILLIIELINSAIEAIVDRISMEKHELSGRAKDLGSAAVFIVMICTAVIWGAILFY